MKTLHLRGSLFHQTPAAGDHLTARHAGLFRQTAQRQILQATQNDVFFLCLQLVFPLYASPGLLGLALEEVLQLEAVTHSGDDEVAHLMQAGGGAVIFQGHREALQAAGVQIEALRQKSLVEGVEGTVVFLQRQSWTQPLDVDHLNPSQKVTDALLQPIRLLEQASVTW